MRAYRRGSSLRSPSEAGSNPPPACYHGYGSHSFGLRKSFTAVAVAVAGDRSVQLMLLGGPGTDSVTGEAA